MDVFSVIADPTRRAVLDILSKRPFTAGEIGSYFSNITQPGMSKHLRVLRKAGLVKVSRKAQKRVYSLNQEGFKELEKWISKYQVFWNANLENLSKTMDNENKGEER